MDETLTPRQRADAAKKERTRSKLLEATDQVMRDIGWDATVEDIIKASGVSTATFYNFYKSRNAVCLDAFNEYVLVPYEQAIQPDTRVEDKAWDFLLRCRERQTLLRAASVADVELRPTPRLWMQVTYLLAGGDDKAMEPMNTLAGWLIDFEIHEPGFLTQDKVERVARRLSTEVW